MCVLLPGALLELKLRTILMMIGGQKGLHNGRMIYIGKLEDFEPYYTNELAALQLLQRAFICGCVARNSVPSHHSTYLTTWISPFQYPSV